MHENRVLILTEAGAGIGFGHLIRCSALQGCLGDHRVASRMVLHVNEKDRVPDQPGRVIRRWLEEPGDLKDYAEEFDTVLIDSYLATQAHLETISEIFRTVAFLDDYNRMVYPGNLIINPNVYAGDIDYKNQHAPVVGGRAYVMLRRSFAAAAQTYRVRDRLQNILITFGGSDVRTLLPGVINRLGRRPLTVDAVAGSEGYQAALKRDVHRDCRIHGYVGAERMAALMLGADAVISAAGQTLHELACLGIPTIAVCTDQNQRLNMESYVGHGFLVDALQWDDPDLHDKIEQTLLTLENRHLRRHLSMKGKSLVDGKGVDRIAKVLIRSGESRSNRFDIFAVKTDGPPLDFGDRLLARWNDRQASRRRVDKARPGCRPSGFMERVGNGWRT